MVLALSVAALLIAATPAEAGGGPSNPAEPWLGSWQQQNEKGTELTVSRTGDSIHLKEEHDQKVVLEYTCKLDGKDCESTDDGHKAKVSVWTNGPKLIELDTRGNSLTRRRYTAKPDGKTLEVEMGEMSAGGKTETLIYTREH